MSTSIAPKKLMFSECAGEMWANTWSSTSRPVRRIDSMARPKYSVVQAITAFVARVRHHACVDDAVGERSMEHCCSARDTVVALLPFYAGLRVGEVVGLDVDDVALSARKGMLQVRGKGRDGGKLRELPLTRPELRTALTAWLEQRPRWPGADTSPALLLNRRGGRLSDRSARTIITDLGTQVGLGQDPGAGSDGGFGPHVLRHTFATQLIRAGTDPVLVADLLGHAGLGSLAIYTQPTDDDRQRALAILTADH